MCSNPQPPAAVVELPLSDLDIAWYMLAEIEVGADLDLGIASNLDSRIAGGCIPLMDASLRIRKLQNYIDRLDVERFVENYVEYIEGAHFLLKSMENEGEQEKPLGSVRGTVPTIDVLGPFDDHVARIGKNGIICFALKCVFEGVHSAIFELIHSLSIEFDGSFPGQQVLQFLNGHDAELEELEKTVIKLIRMNLEHEHVDPRDFFVSGLRFFEWSNQSIYKDFLARRISRWQRAGWNEILAMQSFFLVRPRLYVPKIAEILGVSRDDRTFLANLFLVASDAVQVSFGSEYRNHLKSIAEGKN